jgi:menaquinone-dependent protoporphyrinogen IX oxidase
MKSLILYRSFFGNTKQVADAMAQEIRTLGHESTVQDVREDLPDLHGIDFIFVGAPTRMARVNRKVVNVLKQLKKKGFSDKSVAIFDTYGPLPATPEELEKAKKWIYPGAAGIMQEVAKDQGLNLYSEVLRCEVKGLKGPLADNALEKAVSFTSAFVSTFGKK